MPLFRVSRSLLIKLLVGVIGLLFGVILHEALHIWLHWGEIDHVSLFTHSAIVEARLDTVVHDIQGEEMAAYSLSITTWLVTVIIIAKIHDESDERSSHDILFPRSKATTMRHDELLDVAQRVNLY